MKVKFEERSRGRKSLIQKSPDVYKEYYNETCGALLPADNMTVTTAVFRVTCGKALLHSVILSSQTLAPSSAFNSSRSAASWRHFQMSWFNIQISRAALAYLGHEIKIYAVKRKSSDTFRKSFFLLSLSYELASVRCARRKLRLLFLHFRKNNLGFELFCFNATVWEMTPLCLCYTAAGVRVPNKSRTLTTRRPRLRSSPGQM